MLQREDSPFTISKAGPEALKDLVEALPHLSKYEPFIKKTLAVRILQKSKNFYTKMKFANISKQLAFFGDWDKIETLLFECNRIGLIYTVLDHKNNSLSFDQNLQVAESLVSFGQQLRNAFQRINERRTQGAERVRIFMKVKEKLDEETNLVQERKKEME